MLRIKFLGDCYYCVAGVPIPNEMHAKCCVDLGLRMIKDIREVRYIINTVNCVNLLQLDIGIFFHVLLQNEA